MTDKKTLNTILTSLALQKKQLGYQIAAHEQVMQKKRHSIASFETYSNEYKQQLYRQTTHRVPVYLNNQQFLDKLLNVLYSEREAFNQLETQKAEMLVRYQQLHQKIDGVQELLSSILNEQRLTGEKIEDTLRAELATLRKGQQRMEDNR